MKRAILAFLCATIAATASAYAGTTGVISGTVTDQNGAPIAGAKVEAVSPAQHATTKTNARGKFVFLDLVPQTYTISVIADRFGPTSFVGVVVTADRSLAFNFKLLKPVACADCIFHFYNPRIGANALPDVYIVRTDAFDGFPNAVVMTLMTIPGINMGLGGFAH